MQTKYKVNKMSKLSVKADSVLLIFLFASGSNKAQHVIAMEP